MSSATLQNDRMVSTTRITREEFLQKIFQDNYEDLKTKGTLRTVRLSVPGTEVCLAHILTPTHTEVYQNLGLHIGVHEGEDHTGDQAHGNEDEENGTGHVLPEVSQRRGLPARQAPDQGEEHTDAHSRGHKVLDRDSEGFRHPAQRQHGVIGLPVGVGDKGTGSVERHDGIHPVHQQHDEQQDQGSCREGEHRREILLPVHLPAGYVQPVQEEGFGFVHKCDVVVHDFFAPQAEGNGQGHCQNQRQNGK